MYEEKGCTKNVQEEDIFFCNHLNFVISITICIGQKLLIHNVLEFKGGTIKVPKQQQQQQTDYTPPIDLIYDEVDKSPWLDLF